jgi:PAS domain S-box-containing protein
MENESAINSDSTEVSALRSQVKALAEEISLLRAALDEIPNSVFVKNLDGQYVLANRVAASLAGKLPQELVGKSDAQLLGAEMAEPIQKKDQDILETGLSQSNEEEIAIEGATRIFQTTKSPFKNAKGKITGLLGTSADITQQKRAESALRETKNQLSLIYNTTQDLIWLFSVEPNDTFRLVSLNRAASDVSDCKPDDVLGKTLQELPSLASNIQAGQEHLMETIRRRAAIRFERTYETLQGLFALESTIMPILDTQGKCTHVLAVARDITERKKEQRRQEFLSKVSRVLLRSLDATQTLREVAHLVASELADYCIIYLPGEDDVPVFLEAAHSDPEKTKEMLELFKYRAPGARDIVGARIMKTGKAELHSEVTDEDISKTTTQAQHREYWIRAKLRSSMSVPLHVRGKALGAIHFLSTNEQQRYGPRDLEFAEELCRRVALAVGNSFLYDEAQKALRLREEFLIVASHELRTPLTPISQSIQLLEKTFSSDQWAKMPRDATLKLVTTSHQQLDRLIRLVNGMLTVGQLTTGALALRIKRVDLLELVQRIVDELKEQFEDSRCHVEISSQGPTVGSWDPARIKEVVTHLLSNAMTFGPGKPIRISLLGDNTHVELRVQDFGIGISPGDQKRIFGQFERAVSTLHYGGLGLGLFISNEIIKTHGGSLWVESEVGKGSKFIFKLPISIPR